MHFAKHFAKQFALFTQACRSRPAARCTSCRSRPAARWTTRCRRSTGCRRRPAGGRRERTGARPTAPSQRRCPIPGRNVLPTCATWTALPSPCTRPSISRWRVPGRAPRPHHEGLWQQAPLLPLGYPASRARPHTHVPVFQGENTNSAERSQSEAKHNFTSSGRVFWTGARVTGERVSSPPVVGGMNNIDTIRGMLRTRTRIAPKRQRLSWRGMEPKAEDNTSTLDVLRITNNSHLSPNPQVDEIVLAAPRLRLIRTQHTQKEWMQSFRGMRHSDSEATATMTVWRKPSSGRGS